MINDWSNKGELDKLDRRALNWYDNAKYKKTAMIGKSSGILPQRERLLAERALGKQDAAKSSLSRRTEHK